MWGRAVWWGDERGVWSTRRYGEELLPFSGIGDLQRAVMSSFRQATSQT